MVDFNGKKGVISDVIETSDLFSCECESERVKHNMHRI